VGENLGAKRERKLYFAMVMLNSALLKALHVADSFGTHCAREFPSLISLQDAPSEDDTAAVDGPSLARKYRRRQAKIVVENESILCLKQQAEHDAARLARVHEECRQLKMKLAQAEGTPLSVSETMADTGEPVAEPSEVAHLRGLGLSLKSETGGMLVMSEEDISRARQVKEKLLHTVKEEKARARNLLDKAAEGTAAAADKQEQVACLNKDLEILLEGQGDLTRRMQQLVDEVKLHDERMREEELAVEAEAAARRAAAVEAAACRKRVAQETAVIHTTRTSPQSSPSPHRHSDRVRRPAWERMLQDAVADDQVTSIIGSSALQAAARGAGSPSLSDQLRADAGSFLPSAENMPVQQVAALPDAHGHAHTVGRAQEPRVWARSGSPVHHTAPQEIAGVRSLSGSDVAPAPRLRRPDIQRVEIGKRTPGSPGRAGPLLVPGDIPAADVEALLHAIDSKPALSGRSAANSRGCSVHELPGRGARSGSVHELPQRSKPFVVCSSVQSHHAAAHTPGRGGGGPNRTASSAALHADRQFSKAALRLTRNPSDAQALGKLTSLLVGNISQRGASSLSPGPPGPMPSDEMFVSGAQPVSSCHSSMQQSRSSSRVFHEQTAESVQSLQSRYGRSPSPQGPSTTARIGVARSVSPQQSHPCALMPVIGCEANTFLAAPNKVGAGAGGAWPNWMSMRATYPSPEQRMQQRGACTNGSSPQRLLRCPRNRVAGTRSPEESPTPSSPTARGSAPPLSARTGHETGSEAQGNWQVRDDRARSPAKASVQRVEVVRSASPPLKLCPAPAQPVGSEQAVQGLMLQAGKAGVPTWPAWPSARTTWPTPEVRAQMAANLGANAAHVHYPSAGANAWTSSPGISPRANGWTSSPGISPRAAG